MRIVVKHFADPDETITAIPGKVTAHIEMEDGSGESTEAIDLTLGQQVTYTVTPGSSTEAYLDDTQIQAVLDPAPPAEGAMTERGAAVAEKVRRAMAETPQPWTGADLDEAIRGALGGFVEVEPDGYQRHGEDAADLGERNAAAIQRVGDAAEGSGLAVNPTYAKALGTHAEPEGIPAITPEEARTLHAVWAGDAFDAQFLESVQPKLEAIAGESWR